MRSKPKEQSPTLESKYGFMIAIHITNLISNDAPENMSLYSEKIISIDALVFF